jgi:3-methyladenine DNA glycosylase AlkC
MATDCSIGPLPQADMAEPLKNSFGPEVPAAVASMLESVVAGFEREPFLDAALEGYEALELTARARHIARVLRNHLPSDTECALGLIVDSLGPEIEDAELTGMGVFVYLPFVYFVAEYGVECFEASMRAQYELTKRFTAEFSIRAFLEANPEETLARLETWATDPNVHVRRLVSEGSRPRLPWAPRLPRFVQDPRPVLRLLEMLKDDPELYVRRSVANNLNDIAKDHPELVVEVCARWSPQASPERRWLIRHGLRTLVKQGHEGALAVLGYGRGSPAETSLGLGSDVVSIGGRQSIVISITNPTDETLAIAVDFRVHFVKANGGTAPKVFKGAELALGGGEAGTVRRTLSLAQHTTRRHYPGVHAVDLVVNGEIRPGAEFLLVGIVGE